MHTMTCHHCTKPVLRHEAALRSISLELAAFHPSCLPAFAELAAAVDAVFADPCVVVSAHAGSAA